MLLLACEREIDCLIQWIGMRISASTSCAMDPSHFLAHSTDNTYDVVAAPLLQTIFDTMVRLTPQRQTTLIV